MFKKKPVYIGKAENNVHEKRQHSARLKSVGPEASMPGVCIISGSAPFYDRGYVNLSRDLFSHLENGDNSTYPIGWLLGVKVLVPIKYI